MENLPTHTETNLFTRRMTRRTFAALTGTALVAGLAGCASSGEETEAETATDDANDETDTTDTDADTDAAESEEAALTALHVEGTQLMNASGEAVQLRGISTHGLAWYPDYVNEDCFRQLHDEWGATVVRLAMYTADSGGWCTDGDQDELRDIIARGVAAAVACDLYVIIDWHILSDGDPNTYADEACLFFDEMSELYADTPNVIYEICNEPNGTATWDDVKTYAEEVLPVIRANAPDAVVLVGTPNWSQYVDQAAADPIEGYDNLMYTLHFYAASHTDTLRATMRGAVEDGLPVFVSEFGICDASGAGAIDADSADTWVDVMDELGVSYVAWNLSNKDETSAIIASSCSKTSGFEEDDLSESGAWVVETLTSAAAAEGADDADDEATDEEEDADEEAAASDELSCTWALRNSWESDGACFAQYDLTLENGTDAAISGWKLTVAFDQKISLSDSWNGTYTAKAKKLVIANASYNGTVEAGGTTGDIGFIVSGKSTPEIESVTCAEA